MPIRRSNTAASRAGVLDLSGYEFDSGIKGVSERVLIVVKHGALHLWRWFRGFITSFLGLHYIYVTSWALVVSWILYPEHNMSYTDALFQAVTAVTITGLNTVNINQMKTYQQVVIFVCPLFTHPLTVALAMLFYRLYLYRKRFADIQQTSKFQSKLRRAATTAQHEAFKRGSYATQSNRDLPNRDQPPPAIELQLGTQNQEGGDHNDSDRDQEQRPRRPRSGHLDQPSPFIHKLRPVNASTSSNPVSSDQPSEEDSSTDSARNSDVTGAEDSSYQPSEHVSPLESDGGSDSASVTQTNSPEGIIEEKSHYAGNKKGTMDNANNDDSNQDNRIRFGNLPRPPSNDRDRTPFNPTDMYRSLNMMRHQDLNNEMDENDGPPLVIKSPRDIEADEARGIHSAVFERGEQPQTQQPNMRRFSTTTIGGERPFNRADTLMSTASGRLPRSMTANYLSWTPTVGHNSAFIGLTADQKEELGGIEYRALMALRWFVIAYYVIVIGLGWVFFIPWSYKQHRYASMIRENGVSPVMYSMTTVLSAFNNNGLCTLPNSFTAFWDTAYIPVVTTFVIMLGNVATPIALRFFVWVVFKLSPQFGQTRETLGFLLDHPRRSFMLLFPSVTTWWLILTLILFMVIEVALFMILNHGDHSPRADLPAGPRLLEAYFQSVVTRTVGFTMIDILSQHPAMLILNVIMMYVAIYPVAMSIRKSNVYEEQALGRYYPNTTVSSSGQSMKSGRSQAVFTDDDDDDDSSSAQQAGEEADEDDEDNDTPSTLADHVRRQLGMDIWSLVLGLILIAITEGGAITRGDFSLFDVIFEVSSAHGTVGLSTGYRDTTLALSGGFSNLGKLIMMGIMIRGRHRAMPYNIDRAIILKSDDIMRHDDEQENRARDAHVLLHREPSQSDTWLPRVATTASRLRNVATMRTRRGSEASA